MNRKPKTANLKPKIQRPTWDEYFLGISDLVSKRSTCLRRNVGAVLVKDRRILATGYNGAPSKIRHCSEIGCIREKLKIPSGQRHELCRGLHAEQNAFLQAALHGTSLKDASLYSTTQPCIICAKMIINAGIKEIVIKGDYPDKMSKDILNEAGIKVRVVRAIVIVIMSLMLFSPPLFADGLGSLVEVGRSQEEIAKALRQETKNFENVKKGIESGIIKKGDSREAIRKSYGDPVVELNNEKDGAEKWIYKPESSSYSEGAKIYLTFSSHGTLEEAKMVNNPGPKRP